MAYNYHQGQYEVKNKHKYIGKKNPRFLSSYELQVFQWADRSPNVLKWGSEVVVVPYYNSAKQRKARYIVDLYLKYKNKNGEIREELIEIKPLAQTQPPKRGRKRKDVYEKEVLEHIQNQEKWQAAQKFAKARKWNFRVLTENSIFRG